MNGNVSDSVWEITTAGVDGIAVVFGEAAPDAIRLSDSQSVGCALHHDGAGSADCLGSGFARRAGRAGTRARTGLSEWLKGQRCGGSGSRAGAGPEMVEDS